MSLTFGIAPVSDLLVRSPSGSQFTVDVKGQPTKDFRLIQPRVPDIGHFVILVFLPTQYAPPQYFIISSDELMCLREDYKQSALARGKYRDDLGGINWSTALRYGGKWDTVPP